jgi:prolyl 4-hydroxylase
MLSVLFGLVIVILIIILFFIVTKTTNKNKTKETFNYTVTELPNLLTSEECDTLILFAKNKGLQESNILGKNDTYSDPNNRSSKTSWIRDHEHPIAKKVALISEQLTGLPITNQEALQIAYYQKNGKFNPHYDACVSKNKEYCDNTNKHAGQRKVTLLIYLNDTFEEGTTTFPKIKKTIKPEK